MVLVIFDILLALTNLTHTVTVLLLFCAIFVFILIHFICCFLKYIVVDKAPFVI